MQKTLTPVLKAKALDNRLPDPILGDQYAEQTMRRLDAALAGWHPRLEYAGEAPMNDSPELMAKAPANIRRMYRVMNLLPGFTRSSRIVRFRF